MIIVMQKGAAESDIQSVITLIQQYGLTEHVSRGVERTIIGAVGDERVFEPQVFERLSGVERAMRVVHEWRIVSREVKPEDSIIRVRGIDFGQSSALNISLASTSHSASEEADAVCLTPFYHTVHPYQSKQPEPDWIEAISVYQSRHKPVMVHIQDIRQIDKVLNAGADILYLGAEFVDNRVLQDEVRELNIPLVLEKGRQHTVHELLIAAEYIALGGNHQLMFCEAGTLHFDPTLPLRLDIEAIMLLKALSHLPVLVNINALGNKEVPQNILKAVALAAGVNGIIA